ncbi:MAG: SDR family oxidoreductase [Bacteroidetes bacterium]|nr:SDR family oxidoreductase [Bacteroidota bacterium]
MEREIKSLLVLGATGRTGRHIVEQALKQELRVTVLVRDPEKLIEFRHHPQLEILKGDVTNFPDVYNAVQGNDAIISALGRDGKDVSPITRGTENIIAAIRKSAVSRLICLSSFGAGSTRPESNWILRAMIRIAGLQKSFEAKAQQEILLYKSKINFTLAMAGTLADGSSMGDLFAYSVGQLPCIKGMPKKIARERVASFMLDQLRSQQWSRNTVCILGEAD